LCKCTWIGKAAPNRSRACGRYIFTIFSLTVQNRLVVWMMSSTDLIILFSSHARVRGIPALPLHFFPKTAETLILSKRRGSTV